MVDGGETTDSLEAKGGGAPASTAQVADLASISVTVLWIGPTNVLRAEKGPEKSMFFPKRRKSQTSSPV